MPLIAVHTTLTLTPDKREALKNELGQAVVLIPGKTEQVLMVEIIEGVTLYKGGRREGEYAVVDVKCYKQAAFEDNKRFTEAVFGILQRLLGIPETNAYLSITELPTWGTMGSLK